MLKIKKNEYISLFIIRDIEKITSHPNDAKIYSPEENKKKEKAEFKHKKH